MTEKQKHGSLCGLGFFLESSGKSGRDFSMSGSVNSWLNLGYTL